MNVWRRLGVLALLLGLLARCELDVNNPAGDASPGHDGAGGDTGLPDGTGPADAGPRPDGAPPPDGGPTPDGQPPQDSVPPPDAGACRGENPEGCWTRGCAAGQTCVQDPGSCTPSACRCDEATGSWMCTPDCSGGVCVDSGPCPEPNPQGCVNTGCPPEQTCDVQPDDCVPSECHCDAASGAWQCTRDCGGGRCVPAGVACVEPNPAGCMPGECPVGEECVVSEGDCRPSACTCDPASGTWACTPDCMGGVCVPLGPCAGPNPQGCAETGCPAGEVCTLTSGRCIPSHCDCDPASGQWRCTEDCDGGLCVPGEGCPGPSPQGCRLTGCPEGQYCETVTDDCHPSECVCDAFRMEWVCSGDCDGGICVEAESCPGPNPQGCADVGCPVGEICAPTSGVCIPSHCDCDPVTGTWICTADCSGGTCVSDGSCPGPNPQGCVTTGCPEGQSCEVLPDSCIPSECYCEVDTGSWVCTRDCQGGTCVDTRPCIDDSQCAYGAEWCEAGRCVACDNSGLTCLLFCPPGSGMPNRNGCTPCVCEPRDECTGDQDCPAGQYCAPGSCSPDCPDGDPSCCVGTHCEAWPTACAGENPQGCIDVGCPQGETCVPNSGVCIPRRCVCDEASGQWQCSEDCDGGLCVPQAGCRTDDGCLYGAEWCQNGQCVPCDRSGEVCDIDCGDGYVLAERHGCTPCQCVPANECLADGDCRFPLNVCVAGPACYPWCSPDDPTCCFGNRCMTQRPSCPPPNPQACFEFGCAPGLRCLPTAIPTCMPSRCDCLGFETGWTCTDDCVNGACQVPPTPWL